MLPLIIILLFAIPAQARETTDWNTDKEYVVVDGTTTTTYKPPTKQQIYGKELKYRTNAEIKKQIATGQEWNNNRGRNRAYMLSKNKKDNIRINQVEILSKTTFYDLINPAIGEGGFGIIELLLSIAGAGLLILFGYKKITKG